MLKYLLEAEGLQVETLSIDDFYLSKERRDKLAQEVPPLLASRGVPGTHDVALGVEVVTNLLAGKATAIPIFDKVSDDLLPVAKWCQVENKVGIIIFEGWCVGASPMDDSELYGAENTLEQDKDPQLVWRRYYNKCLKESYQDWFALIDVLLALKVPSIAEVIKWRSQQQGLLESNSDFDVAGFVAYFERLAAHMLETMQADIEFELTVDHKVVRATGKLWI